MFIHLHVHSPYSFLDGASDIETLAARAAETGMPALALTDHNSLAAAVKFNTACRAYGIKPIFGAEVTMQDSSHLTLIATSSTGYATLCRLLTIAAQTGERLHPILPAQALQDYNEGVICLTGCRQGNLFRLVEMHRYSEARQSLEALIKTFSAERIFVELQDDLTPHSQRVCAELLQLAAECRVPAVATNNVHYARADDFAAHDILTCVRLGIDINTPHPARPLNSERYLKSEQQMRQLFAHCPEVLDNSVAIAGMCTDSLVQVDNFSPLHNCPSGTNENDYLRHLAFKGARYRYRPFTEKVESRLQHELEIITSMGFANYFLLAWKTARWARSVGIRCTGRGSAADSCTAYALMLTDVDVISRNLPFARFLSPGKTPDIDLDFDASRRDEVFRFIAAEYGAEHVAMACTFHTYRAKSALRDVGKALALPPELLKFFSKNIAHFVKAAHIEEAFTHVPELKPHIALTEQCQLLFNLCRRIAGFPRHIGTHSSGVVVFRQPLHTLAPMQPTARGILPLITLDKDDVEDVGGMKLDVLSLRILTAVEQASTHIAERVHGFQYNNIPTEDDETYRLLRSGKAMGAFQLESPAQMALACTLESRQFEDLVASVALIRPGPIRSFAVRRFVSCRNGWARADVLHPVLQPVLAKTYGCVIFQEQVVQVLAAMTGASEAEADGMRKRLAKHDRQGTMEQACDEFIARATHCHRDLSIETAQLIWQQIESWSGYGFTEGHAASFAITAQRSAYLSCHHPAEYFAALMSCQPMGYYSANSLAAEARRRGVTILPIDINESEDTCSTPAQDSIRLGLRLVEELRQHDIDAVLAARSQAPFHSLIDFCTRVPLHRNRLENLVLCGAFQNLHAHTRGLLWRLDETIAQALIFRTEEVSRQHSISFPRNSKTPTPCAQDIEDFSPYDKFQWEWRICGVASSCHPLAYYRDTLSEHNIITTWQANRTEHNRRIRVAGLNLRPHRPPTRSGRTTLFTTVEDETDFIQIICTGQHLDSCAPVFLTSPAVTVTGVVKHKGSGVSILVEAVEPLSSQLRMYAGGMSAITRIVPSVRTQDQPSPQPAVLITSAKG